MSRFFTDALFEEPPAAIADKVAAYVQPRLNSLYQALLAFHQNNPQQTRFIQAVSSACIKTIPRKVEPGAVACILTGDHHPDRLVQIELQLADDRASMAEFNSSQCFHCRKEIVCWIDCMILLNRFAKLCQETDTITPQVRNTIERADTAVGYMIEIFQNQTPALLLAVLK